MLSFFAATALSVAPVRLEQLVDLADRIIVAHVDAVATFPRTPTRVRLTQWDSRESFDVARATIVRSIKGTADARDACFLATSTWTCDVSGAVEGETVLLFLVCSTRIGRAATVEPSRFDAFTSKRDVYEIAWAGRGRMPIDAEDDRSAVTWWSNVIVPSSLRLHAEEDSWRGSLSRAPLDEFEACIRGYLAIGNEPLVHAFYRWSAHPSGDWDLRMSTEGDASVRYYRRGATDPDDPSIERRPSEEWVGRIDADALEQLRARLLEPRATRLPDVVGTMTIDAEERILSVFAEPLSAGGERVATTARLVGESDALESDARAERAWSLWSYVDRLEDELTASWGRTPKPK